MGKSHLAWALRFRNDCETINDAKTLMELSKMIRSFEVSPDSKSSKKFVQNRRLFDV